MAGRRQSRAGWWQSGRPNRSQIPSPHPGLGHPGPKGKSPPVMVEPDPRPAPAKRALSTGYTNSYFKLATVPLTLKKNLSKFQNWEDINRIGVKVAVTLGTTQEQQAKEIFPNALLIVIESPARDYQEVLAGRAEVHITSNIEAATLVEQYPEMAIVPVSEPKYPTPLAWLTPQDDQVWINYLNHWIEIKKAQGFFDLMMDKYSLKSL